MVTQSPRSVGVQGRWNPAVWGWLGTGFLGVLRSREAVPSKPARQREPRVPVPSPPFAPDVRTAVPRGSVLGTRVGDCRASLAGQECSVHRESTRSGGRGSSSLAGTRPVETRAWPRAAPTHARFSPLRPPERPLSASPRGSGAPDPWSPALSVRAEPFKPRAPRPGCAAAASGGRAGGAETVGGGRAAAGLGLGRRKPQRQQSPGGEDGEGESGTPARPNSDLRLLMPPHPARPSRRLGRDPTHTAQPHRFGSYYSGFS